MSQLWVGQMEMEDRKFEFGWLYAHNLVHIYSRLSCPLGNRVRHELFNI